MISALVSITLGGLVVFLLGLFVVSLVVATIGALFRGFLNAVSGPFQ